MTFVEHTFIPYESVGGGIFKDPAHMGVSPPPPKIAPISMTFVRSNLWVLPPANQVESWGNFIPLIPTDLNYIEIVSASPSFPEPTPSSKALKSYVQSPWLGDGGSSNPL